MRSLSRAVGSLGLGGLLLFLSAGAAGAADTATSDVVIIREDRLIEDDLYASGERVVIEGTIDGDLMAAAGEEILIEGEVTGNVTALAPRVSVTGTIGRSLRVAARDFELAGSVGKDVVFAGVGGEIAEPAVVEGDVLAWSWDMRSAGEVGGDFNGTFGYLSLSGVIEGDVEVTVRGLAIDGPLNVGGDLGYRSEAEATGLEEADVGGVVAHEKPLPPNIRVRALGLLGRILVALFLAMTSLLVAWGWPRHTERAAQRVRQYGRAYGWGLAVFLSPMVLAAVAGLIVALAPASAGLPLLALLAPVILAFLGVVMALSLVAGVPAVLELGSRLRGGLGMYGAILLGSGVTGAVWLFPVVGWIVPLTVLPLGLGGWLLSLRGVDGSAEVVDQDILLDQA